VSKQREQTKIFKLENGEKTEVQLYPGCISSDFERDIEPYIAEFTAWKASWGMVRLR